MSALVERIIAARDRLTPLTRYGEDAVWRPAKDAREVMADAANAVHAVEARRVAEKRLLAALRAIEDSVAEFGDVVACETWDSLWNAMAAYVGTCRACGLQLGIGPRGDVDCLACNPDPARG